MVSEGARPWGRGRSEFANQETKPGRRESSQKTAVCCRPQKIAGTRSKPQIGVCPLSPCHLRPVTIKPVVRIFEISDSSPIILWGKHGKCGSPYIREKQRGGENSGEGKAYHKTPPQKRFWTPPLMIRFPPPLCLRNVILLRGNGHRPDKSHFLRPPKLVLEGVLYGTFPSPKIAR